MNEQDLARLRSLIAENGVQKYEKTLLELAKPAIRLTAARIDEANIPLGSTKFGGLPDLPQSFPWPTYNGRTLRFLAQINLNEMPADHVDEGPLPRSGMLTFWYDTCGGAWGFRPKDAGSYQVHYFADAPAGLTRRSYPEFAPGMLPEHPDMSWGPFNACAVSATATITVKTDVMSADDPEALFDGMNRFDEQVTGPQPWHRLLGNPQQIQGEMEEECQMASNGVDCGGGPIPLLQRRKAKKLRAGAADWRLLAQIDSDEDGPGWIWGDVGSLYYWIRKQDLQRHDFSGVWGVLQCY